MPAAANAASGAIPGPPPSPMRPRRAPNGGGYDRDRNQDERRVAQRIWAGPPVSRVTPSGNAVAIRNRAEDATTRWTVTPRSLCRRRHRSRVSTARIWRRSSARRVDASGNRVTDPSDRSPPVSPVLFYADDLTPVDPEPPEARSS